MPVAGTVTVHPADRTNRKSIHDAINQPPSSRNVSQNQIPCKFTHQAQQADELRARQQQVEHLQIALDTNRKIGAAVGIVMSQQQLSYPEAFGRLVQASQQGNTKLATVADTVLHTGHLPPASPARYRVVPVPN